MVNISDKILRGVAGETSLAINGNNVGTLIKVLDRLGKLDSKFDKKPLIELLNHQNERIRSLAVKNLAKLVDITLVKKFVNIVDYEQSSIVRREAVSAIGRMRNPINKKILMNYLNDSDPSHLVQLHTLLDPLHLPVAFE